MKKRSNAHFDLIESRDGGKSAGKWREGSFGVVMVKELSLCSCQRFPALKGLSVHLGRCKFRWYRAYAS